MGKPSCIIVDDSLCFNKLALEKNIFPQTSQAENTLKINIKTIKLTIDLCIRLTYHGILYPREN